jgi:hypothetical protein
MAENSPAKEVIEDGAIINGCAGTGAWLGSVFPLVGTAIGAGIGAIIYGGIVIFRENK